jgi:hypothetical protein
VRPPVKVYLDPPYGVEDPFGRFPNPEPPPAEPAPADPPPAVSPPRRPSIPKPKVLEFNPRTGRLEQRPLRPVEPGLETESNAAPASPSAEPVEGTPSPFRELHRWDGHE